jgi:hypothetical protein
MFRLSAHQLDRRLEKLEAMPDAPKTHNILNTFGDNKIGDQIECRGTVYMRLTGEEDAASQKPIVSGLEPSLSPVVMINGLRLDGTWGEPGRIFRQPSIRARGI